MYKRVIVAGGRDFLPTDTDRRALKEMLKGFEAERIVSGGCRGADAFGESIARELGLKVDTFPADWSLGKSAGPARNEKMAAYADACILFPGGRGTADMKRRAQAHGLLIAEFSHV